MAFELKYRKDISQLQSDAAHSTDLKRTLVNNKARIHNAYASQHNAHITVKI
jgi:hypothetical protein